MAMPEGHVEIPTSHALSNTLCLLSKKCGVLKPALTLTKDQHRDARKGSLNAELVAKKNETTGITDIDAMPEFLAHVNRRLGIP
jgi:hypothetical protein